MVSLATVPTVIVEVLSPIVAVIEQVVETSELAIIESLKYAAFGTRKDPSLANVYKVDVQPESVQTRAPLEGQPMAEKVRLAVPPEKPVICRVCSHLRSRSALVFEGKVKASGEVSAVTVLHEVPLQNSTPEFQRIVPAPLQAPFVVLPESSDQNLFTLQ